MGWNSVVVVLNDRLDEIERDPQFGKRLADAIKLHPHDSGRAWVTGQTEVVSVQHADYLQIVAVGGNCGIELSAYLDGKTLKKIREARAQAIDDIREGRVKR